MITYHRRRLGRSLPIVSADAIEQGGKNIQRSCEARVSREKDFNEIVPGSNLRVGELLEELLKTGCSNLQTREEGEITIKVE